MFQPFGEESSTLLLIFYLSLGFCGFLLIILLLSIIFITLSEDHQILVTINTEENKESNTCEKSEVETVNNCDTSITVVKQSEQTTNGLLMKGQQMIILFWKLFKDIIQFPMLLYFHFVQWTLQLNNDFIRIE